jgi:hypothetical protein
MLHRIGPMIAVAAALVVLITWPRVFDLEAHLGAARLISAGLDPYAATRVVGVDAWGQLKVFVSPPLLAHALSPFAGLPDDVVFVGWTVASALALALAFATVDRRTLFARAPVLIFTFAYTWGSLRLGTVNLFSLAGLLMALGSRDDRYAGIGLAFATVTRAYPGAFALVLLIDRRWRALAWAGGAVVLFVLINPADWLSFLSVARDMATLPTLPVMVQTSLAPWPLLRLLVAVAFAAIVVISVLVKQDRALRLGTAIGLAIVLLPGNAWHHWLTFALAPLMLYGDDRPWSRAAILAFMCVSFLPIGPLSSAIAVATVLWILVLSGRDLRDAWPQLRPKAAAILGRP